jgi:1-deoxy-D-xylulose-5-phosphate reductoisomerase
MRTPIAHALAWPERLESGVARLDLFAVQRLDFEPPDLGRFPCLALAMQAAAVGGTAPAVLNAANEVAVAAFLDRQIGFQAIAGVVEETLAALPAEPVDGCDVAFLLEVDGKARTLAEHRVNSRVA